MQFASLLGNVDPALGLGGLHPLADLFQVRLDTSGRQVGPMVVQSLVKIGQDDSTLDTAPPWDKKIKN